MSRLSYIDVCIHTYYPYISSKHTGCDPRQYISVEYKLDSLIHKLSGQKPVVAVCDGIVMGGGAGLHQGAGWRVVTPNSLFAMPECRIAIIPDAGAMGFLFRMPGEIPLYCAMTGARLSGHCMKATGLATHLLDPTSIPELLTALRTKPNVDVEAELNARELVIDGAAPVHSVLISFLTVFRHLLVGIFEENMYIYKYGHAYIRIQIQRRQALIDKVFSKSSVREIYNALLVAQKEEETDKEWLKAAITALETECPSSHVTTLHAIRTAQRIYGSDNAWDIDRGLGMEYVAVSTLGFRPDFIEGVQTAVGDRKGETPKWEFASWEAAAKDPILMQLREQISEARPIWEYIPA